MRGVLAAVVGVFVITSGAMAEPPVGDDEAGWWHFHISVDVRNTEPDSGHWSAPVSFHVWLPGEGDPRPAYVRNADEFIEVNHSIVDDSVVLIEFPHYDSFLRGTLSKPEGSPVRMITGFWSKKRSDTRAVMQFIALEVKNVWPPSSGYFENVQVTSVPKKTIRWDFDFSQSGQAIGVFTQTGRSVDVEDDNPYELNDEHELNGTILTPTGDYRFLSGSLVESEPQEFMATVFDGAHAFRFSADIDPDTGDLTNGHFYSGNHWHETFTARRLAEGEEYELPDPFDEVSLKPGVTRLGIERLDEAPYAGKPTIVQVFGTWCPNCHDEAPVLVDLYERYHDEGLQILSLAYEYTDDPERSRQQIDRFKERHGATWEFVAAGVNDKTKTAATLPALSAIKSYPTTIWINPDGTVRAIHSGFSGPATGDAHEETLAEFEKLTREIVEAR